MNKHDKLKEHRANENSDFKGACSLLLVVFGDKLLSCHVIVDPSRNEASLNPQNQSMKTR